MVTINAPMQEKPTLSYTLTALLGEQAFINLPPIWPSTDY